MTSTPTADRTVPVLGRPPLVLLVPALLVVVFLLLPLVALLARTPWSTFGDQVRSAEMREALWLSLETSLITVAVCVLFGTPLAWVLARVPFRGRAIVRAVVAVPLVLPPVVGGVALLAALGRNGLIGRPIHDATGLALPFTTAGVVVAHVFVALPFYVLAAEGAFRASGAGFDAVAATLGADRWTTFRRVTLPLALPGVVAGSVLAWARSLGEFGATITFAGNFPGTTRTMPSLIYTRLQADVDLARTLGLILLVVSIVILAALRDRWWRLP